MAVLSPEIILLGFRHFRGREWGKGGDQQNTHSPGIMAKGLVCGTRRCAESGTAKLSRTHSDKPAAPVSQSPRWPGWCYLHGLTLRSHQLEFFCAHWERQQGFPLHMLEENQEVALEAVGVPLDIQTDHMGPVKVILLVGQDGDNHLEQRCRGAARAGLLLWTL